jgi:DNA polymerase alpha subunit A
MLAENKPVNIGDHIPYVICLQGAEGSTPTQRAYHPDEVFKSKGELTIDVEWYLSQQILPPISRLCEPIEGTSVAQISLQLGLDASKFTRSSNNEDEQQMDWGFTPRSMMEDSERFRDTAKLKIACKSCGISADFPGVYSPENTSGLTCSSCGAMYYGLMNAAACYGYLSNATTLVIRQCVKRYYDCWLRCDDLTCGRRTIQQAMNGYGCVGDCHGRMKQEYDESTLHTQLKYLESLFDVEKALKKKERVEAGIKPEPLPKDHVEIFRLLNKHMFFAIENNAYNWIRPSLWTTMSRTLGK